MKLTHALAIITLTWGIALTACQKPVVTLLRQNAVAEWQKANDQGLEKEALFWAGYIAALKDVEGKK